MANVPGIAASLLGIKWKSWHFKVTSVENTTIEQFMTNCSPISG